MHSSKEDGSEAFHGGHVRACTGPDSCSCLFISTLHAASHSALSVSALHLLFVASPPGFATAGRAGQRVLGLPRVRPPPPPQPLPARSQAGAPSGAADFSYLPAGCRAAGGGPPAPRSASAGGCCWPGRKVMKPGASASLGPRGRCTCSPVLGKVPSAGGRAACDGGVLPWALHPHWGQKLSLLTPLGSW